MESLIRLETHYANLMSTGFPTLTEPYYAYVIFHNAMQISSMGITQARACFC